MTKQDERKIGLGRGLAGLLHESFQFGNNISEEDGAISILPLSSIIFNADQPRQIIDEEGIENLAASIREHGVLQPIIVRKVDQDKYQIIAGERRYHAAKKAGLQEISVIIRNMNDRQSREIAIVENIQRQNLSALEEAEAYRKMIDEDCHTQDSIAKSLGISRSHLSNMLRLLKLPKEVKDMLTNGQITVGHAKLLINVDNPLEFAYEITKNNLSVRGTENLIKSINDQIKQGVNSHSQKNTANIQEEKDILHLQEIAENIGMILGDEVRIKKYKGGKYSIIINCLNLRKLDSVIEKLNNQSDYGI